MIDHTKPPLNHRRYYDVACRYCGAKVGMLCKSKSGRPAETFVQVHAIRRMDSAKREPIWSVDQDPAVIE
jgi:hypothetical protein